jgi:hypothetical protein
MAIGVVHNESSIALVAESTEGTYVAPTLGTQYVECLSSGLSLVKNTEELSRDTLGSTIEAEASRRGIPNVEGSIPVELRASATAGTKPQSLDIQLRSLLGGSKSEATKTATSATSTVITFASHSFTVGSSVLVKESGAYEVRPISAVDSTTITFPFALTNGAPSATVVVEAVITYYHDVSNAISFCAEYNIGNTIQDQVDGLKCTSGSIENWSAGTIPTMNFGVTGLDLNRSDSAQTATPDFTADALPPVALEACLWIGGTKFSYSELSLSIENETSPIMDACDPDGKSGQRAISQNISFSANPYMDDTTFANFTLWENNTDVSVFFYAFNPSSTAGEFSEAVAVWLPQGKITALPTGDNNGLATDAIEIKAHRSSGSDSIFMSFI